MGSSTPTTRELMVPLHHHNIITMITTNSSNSSNKNLQHNTHTITITHTYIYIYILHTYIYITYIHTHIYIILHIHIYYIYIYIQYYIHMYNYITYIYYTYIYIKICIQQFCCTLKPVSDTDTSSFRLEARGYQFSFTGQRGGQIPIVEAGDMDGSSGIIWLNPNALPSGKHTKKMERSTIFHGKIHFFNGDFPVRYVRNYQRVFLAPQIWPAISMAFQFSLRILGKEPQTQRSSAFSINFTIKMPWIGGVAKYIEIPIFLDTAIWQGPYDSYWFII